MRQALRSKAPQRQQISVLQSYPAPIGGWNKRDALAEMKPTDAVDLVGQALPYFEAFPLGRRWCWV